MTLNNDPTTTDSVCDEIIEEVAAITGQDPLEIDPLYDAVDPDCLESIFSDDRARASRSEGCVVFPMEGCEVVVRADQSVDVELIDEGYTTPDPSVAEEQSSRASESPD